MLKAFRGHGTLNILLSERSQAELRVGSSHWAGHFRTSFMLSSTGLGAFPAGTYPGAGGVVPGAAGAAAAYKAAAKAGEWHFFRDSTICPLAFPDSEILREGSLTQTQETRVVG